MSYIEKNLLSNEMIVEKAKIHWFIYVPPAFLLFLGIVASNAEETFAIKIAIIIVSVFLLIRAYITVISTELAVTNKRVVAKHGFIMRKTIELNLSKVEGLSVDQGICGRILNFGKVTVNGVGGVRAPFKFISYPLKLRKAVNEEFEKIEMNK